MKEEKWPAVDAAFAFVLPSYQWMLARIEAADSRVQSLQVSVLTLATALPALAKSLSVPVSFASPLFVIALAIAAAALVLGAIGRSSGRVTLVDPALLYSTECLRREEREFRREMLYYAGQHFAKNAALVVFKHRMLIAMTVLFVLEVLSLAAWLVSAGA
jgi:hypothetical protein